MKTNKKHFTIFKKSCEYWIKKLGLDNWDIYFHHKNPKSEDSVCDVSMSYSGRRADIRFGVTTFEENEINTKYIKETAKHEVIHILLGELTAFAEQACSSREQASVAVEDLTVKLTKIIK